MTQHTPHQLPDIRHDEALTALLRDYLAEHPLASDTVEGIAEWWISRQLAHSLVRQLTGIVHRLTADGVLEQVGTGQETRYRLKSPAIT